MIAVVLLHNGSNTWRYSVAKNYTQLNFDYCMADRVGDSDYQFFQTQDINSIDVNKFEYCIVLRPGIIFEYSYWESKVRSLVEATDAGIIRFNNPNVWIIRAGGTGEITLELDRYYPTVDPTDDDTFSQTHTSSMNTLVQNSNISYIIHNEIPNPKQAHQNLDFAMTVSSGFYINYVLNLSSFDSNTSVHHMDVSPMSLTVRQYTIENWNGEDFYAWMDHIYKRFELLEIFNGKYRLHSHHPAARRCWQHVVDTFGTGWLDHWQQYQQCKHTFNTVNFMDNTQLRTTLNQLDLKGNGAFWWNGALKRLPANVLKSSDQSYQGAIDFFRTLAEYNPDIAGYGSDHCVTSFNGATMDEICTELNKNSREELWKKLT